MAQELTVQGIHRGGMRVALSARGHRIEADYPMGDREAEAPTSLELLLASLASCAANGLAALLRRDGVVPASLQVKATGQRRESHPTVLDSIHLHFSITGEGLKPDHLARLVETAERHLCPVWVMVGATTPITHSIDLA